MHFLEHLGRVRVHLFVVDHRDGTELFGGVASHINIFADAALRDGLQFLMHHGNAPVQRIQRAFDLDFFTLVNDFAFIHVIDAEHTFHQGGFARAILAHQRMDGAGPQLQLRVVQCLNAREGLDNATHFQTIFRQFACPLLSKVKGCRCFCTRTPVRPIPWDYLNSATLSGVTLT